MSNGKASLKDGKRERCPFCKFRIRGSNHWSGKHHLEGKRRHHLYSR